MNASEIQAAIHAAPRHLAGIPCWCKIHPGDKAEDGHTGYCLTLRQATGCIPARVPAAAPARIPSVEIGTEEAPATNHPTWWFTETFESLLECVRKLPDRAPLAAEGGMLGLPCVMCGTPLIVADNNGRVFWREGGSWSTYNASEAFEHTRERCIQALADTVPR